MGPMAHEQEIEEAIAHHRAGRPEEARAIYQRVLGENPDSPEALNFLGVMHSQRGDSKLAAKLLQRSITVAPHYADAHCNFGNVLIDLGHPDEARTAYENALRCDPDSARTHNNLGVLLRVQGELHPSLKHLLLALMHRPGWGAAHMNLGNTYELMKYPDRALEQYRKAVELSPRLGNAQRLLGQFLCARGDRAGATSVFRRLLEIDSENAVAHHMLAACSGKNALDRASQAYIEQTFDDFAASFEQKLEQLEYRGPQMIAAEMATHLPEASKSLRCLDLGCGTGLCAPLVSDWAGELVGVDLSPKMLERAAGRQLYDELVTADLVDYLAGSIEPFDLMFAADVFVYFGALDALLSGVSRSLVQGGWLFFTVEKCENDSARDLGYVLEPHGRYAHTRDYLEEQVAEAGLELVAISEEILRSEMKKPVPSWLVSAIRPTD